MEEEKRVGQGGGDLGLGWRQGRIEQGREKSRQGKVVCEVQRRVEDG